MSRAGLPLSPLRTLGVDPGIARLGYSVVAGTDPSRLLVADVIETKPDTEMHIRLLQVFNALDTVIRDWQPQALAVEQLFFARNVTNALVVGQARGVVLLLAAQHDLPVHEYKPSEVKQTVTGYGKADKQQVQEMVRLLLGLERAPHPDDAADAAAIALCHLHHERFSVATRGR